MATNEWDGDEWVATVRWSATLTEPLLPRTFADQVRADLQAVTERHPIWAREFFAGVISDLAGTLPPNDPWRTARIINGRPTIAGRKFGTVEDHFDLLPLITEEPAMDIGLVAVAEDVDERAAACIVAGFHSRRDVQRQLEKAADEDVLFVGAEAVRLAAFRRRSMMGIFDALVTDSCWWWSEQTYRLQIGETDRATLESLSDERIRQEAVDPERYVPDIDETEQYVDLRLVPSLPHEEVRPDSQRLEWSRR